MNTKIAAVITALLATQPALAEPKAPVVIGYVPAFKGMGPIMAKADIGQYTHLNLSFINPDPTGAVVSDGKMTCMPDAGGVQVTSESLRTAVDLAHAKSVKVLVSLGGGTIPQCSGDWRIMLEPHNRDIVVADLIKLVDDYGLDGLDVDIEGALLTEIDKAGNYTPFIAALSAALKARGKLLTCATASYEGGMIPISSIPYFDLVNVMAYDAIGPSWGTPGDEHSPLSQAKRDMDLWRARGVPKDKLVLGVPFYGYGFGDYKDGYGGMRDLIARYGEDILKTDVIGKRCGGCSYVTYNGLETLQKKTKLAADKGAGIMVWEISQDTDDHRLITTAKAALKD
ncbi:glycosyl hydrolase family 18 protein [Asticcacaulis machinosus]|uniref:chitinase n=1 Tax=Asticcacaulis machinosus TaxID=2984211 RepID=A0ABT5HE28_9CAUL|nr:glycosyl hydrolase family 18 protein [Asticcacaulis machinosus]MDC7674512.1 glycosyl hydrolase family 18 protein [Asticcacaulis machinosus]